MPRTFASTSWYGIISDSERSVVKYQSPFTTIIIKRSSLPPDVGEKMERLAMDMLDAEKRELCR